MPEALYFLITFLSVFVLCPVFIKFFRRFRIVESCQKNDSKKLDDLMKTKGGTPTMGGILILACTLVVTLTAGESLQHLKLVLQCFLFFGGLGLLDDLLKLHRQKGLGIFPKIVIQVILCSILAYQVWLLKHNPSAGLWYQVLCFTFYMVYILFWINAVNIADGLDGLACGCYLITFGGILFVVVLILQMNVKMLTPSLALLGGCLGFLWYNKYPAKIFMGDAGSLPLGGYLGIFLCINHLELIGVIAGGIFLIEFLSSLLQIVYFKITGRRLFLIAPLHHHFQFKDVPEPKITLRFWLGSMGFTAFVIFLCLW